MSEIINGTYSHGEHRPIAKMSKSLGMKANKKQHSQLITENTAQGYLTIFPSEHPKIYAYVNCAICINILRFFDLLHCLRTSSLYLIVCFCSFLLVYFLLFFKKNYPVIISYLSMNSLAGCLCSRFYGKQYHPYLSISHIHSVLFSYFLRAQLPNTNLGLKLLGSFIAATLWT